MKDGDIIQIAHLVSNLDDAIEHYYHVCNIGPWDIYTYGPHNIKNSLYRGKPAEHVYKIAVCWVNGVQMELMQPVSGYSIYDEYIEKHGYGLHHLKLYFKDCRQAIADYEKRGYQVVQSGNIGDDVFYYLDTEERFQGAVIELGNAGAIPEPESRYPA
ncbi:VOC family protein [Sodalis ligni]|jgi:methylmalonyl-CoA/ethylmalonyl-CoA epimerase|uniref:Glyoxalase/bleomycin resistance protein/dioxygenase superfamily protein n=1 Tax=Sodalis ligni TaxID=2697027 RepID=A0A4R1NHW8_9GAMM|nr:VOC family protein [Sodalis ligni]QWA12253.1 VOC family protein [Sodalis ligni]TCL04336.1 glyoxalase/bleomycin resistance protein/dioxygenase superfamily protein [Sodalis ligni]